MAAPESVRLKVVVVGDAGVGKTSLLTVFKSGVFPEVRRSLHARVYGRVLKPGVMLTS